MLPSGSVARARRLQLRGQLRNWNFRPAPHSLFALAPSDRRRGRVKGDAAAPAILDHETRRGVGIERSHLVIDVTAERGAYAPLFAQREVIALSYIVQAEKLYHQVVGGIASGLNERNGVMARIGVEEIG